MTRPTRGGVAAKLPQDVESGERSRASPAPPESPMTSAPAAADSARPDTAAIRIGSASPASPPAAPAALAPLAPLAPIVELDGLSVSLGGRPVLRQLEASLAGRCIGLLGPNGAGKTTLLHTLLGFYRPSGGTARVFGRDIRSGVAAIRAQMGYMPETDSFIAGMSGVRFVRLMAELSGLPAAAALERAHEALFYVGLGEARYRPVDSYSQGMKQLVKLAQALAHGPRLLFLDEPTNGLDPPARRRMLELIRSIRDGGEARVILSSHLLRDVEECCEEVLVLKAGRVAVYANLEEERRANRRLLELEVRAADGAGAAPAFAEMAAALGCECALGAGRPSAGAGLAAGSGAGAGRPSRSAATGGSGAGRLKLVLPDGVEVSDLFRLAGEARLQIRRLDYKRDSLEDIFLKAMEEDLDGRL
jgi:ABC-2 type transport system ATP-binding protein